MRLEAAYKAFPRLRGGRFLINDSCNYHHYCYYFIRTTSQGRPQTQPYSAGSGRPEQSEEHADITSGLSQSEAGPHQLGQPRGQKGRGGLCARGQSGKAPI